MKAHITHFVTDDNGDSRADPPIHIPLGNATNTHHAMRKIHERLTESQIPSGTFITVITINHTDRGVKEGKSEAEV